MVKQQVHQASASILCRTQPESSQPAQNATKGEFVNNTHLLRLFILFFISLFVTPLYSDMNCSTVTKKKLIAKQKKLLEAFQLHKYESTFIAMHQALSKQGNLEPSLEYVSEAMIAYESIPEKEAKRIRAAVKALEEAARCYYTPFSPNNDVSYIRFHTGQFTDRIYAGYTTRQASRTAQLAEASLCSDQGCPFRKTDVTDFKSTAIRPIFNSFIHIIHSYDSLHSMVPSSAGIWLTETSLLEIKLLNHYSSFSASQPALLVVFLNNDKDVATTYVDIPWHLQMGTEGEVKLGYWGISEVALMILIERDFYEQPAVIAKKITDAIREEIQNTEFPAVSKWPEMPGSYFNFPDRFFSTIDWVLISRNNPKTNMTMKNGTRLKLKHVMVTPNQ